MVDPKIAEPQIKVTESLIEPCFDEISSCGDDNDSEDKDPGQAKVSLNSQ